jgi:hypothetical protein
MSLTVSSNKQNVLWIHLDMPHGVLQGSKDGLQAMIENEAIVINAYDEPTALLLLNSSHFAAVFIMNTLGPRRYPDLTKALVSYAKVKGGTVIIGFGFPNFVRWDMFHELFEEFGKKWKSGSYTKVDYVYNGPSKNKSKKKGKKKIPPSTQLQELHRRNNGQPLPQTFYVKALHAWGVAREEAVYLSDRFKQSAKEEPIEAPIAFASVGNGWLGYLGTVNCEHETLVIAKAMIGLGHGNSSEEKTLLFA